MVDFCEVGNETVENTQAWCSQEVVYKLRVVPNYFTKNKKRRRPGEIHALCETRRARKARGASHVVEITRVRVSVSRLDLRLLARS